MKNLQRRTLAIILMFSLLFSMTITSFAAPDVSEVDKMVNEMSRYMLENVPEPQVGSIGGEWAVIGLARSGYDVPEKYFQDYYARVEEYVKAREGKLHDIKYTEYSRLILALTSIGKDPRNVGGYDLIKPLSDYEAVLKQGLNGPIFALIALDSGNYELKKDSSVKIQSTREMFVDYILKNQLDDGGWDLMGEEGKVSDPDITAMALQALSKYSKNKEVEIAIEMGLNALSNLQIDSGGYKSWGTENLESTAQVIVALGELGIDIDDERFIKNNKGLFDAFKAYYKGEKTGFIHDHGGSGVNQMSSEQGFYATVSLARQLKGKPSLYIMRDNLTINTKKGQNIQNSSFGLSNKHSSIKRMEKQNLNISFSDTIGHKNKQAIDELADRNIINGKSENVFDPNGNMTRAEFATIVVRALGLEGKSNNKFTDVKTTDWFSPYVGTASDMGIIAGVGNNKFNPNGLITVEEAATMVARAANMTGIDKKVTEAEVRDILAQFNDYPSTSEWSRKSLALLYIEKIADSSSLNIEPKRTISRGEIAQLIYNLLDVSKLL